MDSLSSPTIMPSCGPILVITFKFETFVDYLIYKAAKELEKGWTMMKMAVGEPRWDQWVAQNLKEGATVGYNPLLLSARIFFFS